MGKSELEERFKEYREYLLQEAQKLSGFFFVYRQLQEMEGSRFKAMRYAPAFFAITKASLLSSIILWTDKLFDRGSQRGFANFLSFVGTNLSLFALSELQRRTGFDEAKMVVREPVTPEVVQRDREQIEGIASLPSFKLRRDKYHAHFDKAYFFQREKLQEDAPLKKSDFEEVEAVMSVVLNRYSEAYDATVYRLGLGNVNDLAHLLDRVRDDS